MMLDAYARQSKTDARSVPSTDWQIAEATQWAGARGHEVIERHVDVDTSGYSRKVARPGFDALLDRLRSGAVDGVLVWRLDRLSRQGQWGPDVLRFMEARGDAVLLSVCEDVDTSTAAGELILGVRLSMARGESEAISTRWRTIKRRLAEQGQMPSGGRRPFGWRDGSIDHAEAELIREAAERVLAGDSLRSIVLDWRARSIPTSTGGEWTAASLRYLLRQWRLAGIVEHHGAVLSEDGPAVLEVGEVRRLRALLDDPSRRTAGRPVSRLLSGVLRCGKCGARMRGATRNRKPAYACPAKPDGCAGVAIIAAPLDADVTAAVRQVLSGATFPAPAQDGTAEADLVRRIDEREHEMDALAADYAAGRLGRRAFSAASVALEQETDRLHAALGRERSKAMVASAARRLDAGEAWDDLDHDRQRAVVAALVERITIAPATPGLNRYDDGRVEIAWA